MEKWWDISEFWNGDIGPLVPLIVRLLYIVRSSLYDVLQGIETRSFITSNGLMYPYRNNVPEKEF